MLHFDSDYMEGAHPVILDRLAKINFEKHSGYGSDAICAEARAKIRTACACPEAQVSFLVGGTQTNATIIDALLLGYQGVLSAVSGHINQHEAGAIEAGGHKVLALPQLNGKISAAQVAEYMELFLGDDSYEHMVEPGMVYISHPTELGTLYSKAELEALQAVCEKHKLANFLDGARLGYGLASSNTDVTLADIARLVDVFYIGGTKVGALFGEAVVFPHPQRVRNFFTISKQHGAVLAKGWLLGVQFAALFTDDLYLEISRNAIIMAERLVEALEAKGYRMYVDSPTNQQFVIMENARLAELSKHVSSSFIAKYDDRHTVVRFATSWATTAAEIEALVDLL